jgi:glucosylceramidase
MSRLSVGVALLGLCAGGQAMGVKNGAGGGIAVQTWLSTGDQAKTLSHEPNIYLVSANSTSQPTIEVDDATTYQQMIGFGAAVTDASAYLIQEKMTAAQRAALLQDIFGRNPGIGLSFMRVPMGASDFSLSQYSYDDMPAGQTDSTLAHFSIAPDTVDKLPVLRQALAINPALTLMGTPWSPPGWMKTTGSLIQGTLLTQFYDSFANYLARFVQAYAAAGVPVTAISVQNEPHFQPTDYPGMELDIPARAVVIGGHVGPTFARLGLRTQIWDWDHNWDLPSSPLGVLGDSAANSYVQGVAWHCYAGTVSAQSTVHAAYPNKDTFFTECSGGDWAPNYPTNLVYFVGTLIIGTTQNWARSVALWNLALDENDGPHTGGCTNCRGVVTINSTTGAVTRNVEYVALAHASQFVRPGAYRVASTSGIQGLTSVAFRNSDDGSKVLIVLNSATTAQPFVVRWAGQNASYTLPPSSVATFTWN